MGIHEDLQGFMRLWERIHKDLWEFAMICETLGRIHRDSQGFTRLWERICETLGKDS